MLLNGEKGDDQKIHIGSKVRCDFIGYDNMLIWFLYLDWFLRLKETYIAKKLIASMKIIRSIGGVLTPASHQKSDSADFQSLLNIVSVKFG